MNMQYLSLALVILFFVSCSKEQPQSTGAVRYVNAANGLTLRDQPSQNGKALALVPNGTQVNVIQESSEKQTIAGITATWAQIKFQGKTGWLFAGYLQNSQNSNNASSSFIGRWDDCLVLKVDHGVYLSMVLDASGDAKLGFDNPAKGTWTFDSSRLKIESNRASVTIEVEDRAPRKFCGSITGSGDVTLYGNSVQTGNICFCK